MVVHIHLYKPIGDKIEANIIDLTTKVVDKGKKKVIGVKINEPIISSKKGPTMSNIYLELEKDKKEGEYLAKELEKVENVEATKMRKNFNF